LNSEGAHTAEIKLAALLARGLPELRTGVAFDAEEVCGFSQRCETSAAENIDMASGARSSVMIPPVRRPLLTGLERSLAK
jgi:hypothetical protein